MKEIKLIVSQEKLEENRRNQLLKDRNRLLKYATKKNYEKQEKIVGIVKKTIAILLLTMLMIWGLYLGQSLKQKGIKGCMENGYSESYCIQHS